MSVRQISPETTLTVVREQLKQLEQQADALRSGLDEISILLAWTLEHSVSASALQKVTVTERELAEYQAMLTEKYPDSILRLVIQAQKVASQFKRSLPPEDRNLAIRALHAAFDSAATSENLSIPDELEAVIGD